MGAKGIHLSDAITEMEADHRKLADSIRSNTDKLIFDELNDIFNRTRDARVLGFIKDLQKTVRELLPSLVKGALDKWEENEDDLVSLMKRLDQDDNSKAEARICIDHVRGYYDKTWLNSKDYKTRILLGDVDNDYSKTIMDIQYDITKYIDAIAADCSDYEKRYKAVLYEREENSSIYWSFKLIREALSYGNLYDQLTSGLEEKITKTRR